MKYLMIIYFSLWAVLFLGGLVIDRIIKWYDKRHNPTIRRYNNHE